VSQPAGLHVCQIFQPTRGGVPAYVAGLTEGLIADGWRVSVVAPAENSETERLRASGAQVLGVKLAMWPSPHDRVIVRETAALCRGAVDVIHGHSTKASLLAAAVSRRTGIPSVYTPHCWGFERARNPLSRAALIAFERRMSRVHRELIAVSENERRLAAKAGIHSSMRLVHTGLADQRPAAGRAQARAQLGLDEGAVIAAWVGRRSPQKRPQDLGPLAASLRTAAVQLVAIGYGLGGSVEGDALLAAGGRLLEGADPRLLLAAADIFVQTSAWEATSLAVLEAMAAGLPVVAYGVGGLPDQVGDGVSGHLVAEGAVGELASRAIELARSPPALAAFGAAGRRRFEERFSYPQMISSTEAIYRAVSAAGNAGAGS
jgi:glycosyltransferase involved in cell wall biosynthesis